MCQRGRKWQAPVGSTHGPWGLQLKGRDGDFKGERAAKMAIVLDHICAAHGTDSTSKITSGIVFKNTPRKDFGLNADNTISHHFSTVAQSIHNVPFSFQDLNALFASVLNNDAIGEDEFAVLGPRKFPFKSAAYMHADALCGGAVDLDAHVFNLMKTKIKVK